MDNLDKTLQDVKKTMTTATGAALLRENLSGIVNRLAYKETPIRDRLSGQNGQLRKNGTGSAATWTVATTVGTGNAACAEVSTPNEDDAGYNRRSAVFKQLAKKKSISDMQDAAGENFTDQEAEQTEIGMYEVVADEELYTITGSTGTSALQYDGLDAYITTNIIDDANNSLGFRTAILAEAVLTIKNNYGINATAIYCNFAMKAQIDASMDANVRVNIDNTNAVTTGLDVSYYQSLVGKLPIIATSFIPNKTISEGGVDYTASDIYVVTESNRGAKILYMEDLIPMRKLPLARTGTSYSFMIQESTVFVCRAEEMQVKIANVRIK